jgi:hypothetical protein
MIRVVAIIMLIMSVSGLVVSCEMDTSVPAGFGRVVNLPLAAQPQNLSLISAVLFVGGIILFATGRPMLSLPERGAAEDAALKHVIALERRLSTAVISTNQLAIFFISIVTFLIYYFTLFVLFIYKIRESSFSQHETATNEHQIQRKPATYNEQFCFDAYCYICNFRFVVVSLTMTTDLF